MDDPTDQKTNKEWTNQLVNQQGVSQQNTLPTGKPMTQLTNGYNNQSLNHTIGQTTTL